MSINDLELLGRLDEPIINLLLIEIVRIIEFFCREFDKLELRRKRLGGVLTLPAEQRLMGHYTEVCEKMDGVFREEALFNCLKIPSDDVKLATVKCLFYVPLHQFD